MQIPESHIALTIKSQIINAEDITSRFGLKPYGFANKGNNTRQVSPGKIINTGLHKTSSWTHIFKIEDSKIEEKLIEIITICELEKLYISKILNDSGLVEAQIRLSGKNNVGDILSADTLKKLSLLGMSLSIEVFP